MNQEKVIVKTKSNVLFLAFCGVGIALVYVCTAFANIRLPFAPNGGLIHLGNVPLFFFAAYYGKYVGAIAGGVGMAMFDWFSPYAAWAPYTLVIVALIGFIFGAIVENHITFSRILLAGIAACIIKVGGYYLAEGIMYGNFVTPVTSILGNVIQMGTAMVVGSPIILACKPAMKYIRQNSVVQY